MFFDDIFMRMGKQLSTSWKCFLPVCLHEQLSNSLINNTCNGDYPRIIRCLKLPLRQITVSFFRISACVVSWGVKLACNDSPDFRSFSHQIWNLRRGPVANCIFIFFTPLLSPDVAQHSEKTPKTRSGRRKHFMAIRSGVCFLTPSEGDGWRGGLISIWSLLFLLL